jgi:cytoskeletal protein RodZ
MPNDVHSKSFLEEIQSLSDVAKKRVLIISTIIIMVIVVGVWFSYFNNILAQANHGASEQTASAAATVAPSDEPSPFPATATTTTDVAPTASANAAAPAATPSGPTLWQHIENGFNWIGNIFKGPSNYTIQPQSN